MTEVTKEEAICFIERAMRNWPSICCSTDDLEDFRKELERFARHREASTEALRTALRRIESAEYINSLQGTANFERLQQIARAALENRDD